MKAPNQLKFSVTLKKRLDHENFVNQLEPYQLNPTLDKSELKPEEFYTIKFLDKLGISKNLLIACNLPTANAHHNLNHTHSHLYLAPSAPTINTVMDNLISSKETLNYLTSQAYNYQRSQHHPHHPLTVELKQSVNGTYRIIFHCIQKKMRNELNSEESVDSFVNREYLAAAMDGSTPQLTLKQLHQASRDSNSFEMDYPESSFGGNSIVTHVRLTKYI